MKVKFSIATTNYRFHVKGKLQQIQVQLINWRNCHHVLFYYMHHVSATIDSHRLYYTHSILSTASNLNSASTYKTFCLSTKQKINKSTTATN